MGNTIPDAVALISAARHRSLHRKKSSSKRSTTALIIRIAIVTALFAGIIGGVNAVMLHVLG